MSVNWVQSSGGPLVLIPAGKLPQWSGVYSKETLEPLPDEEAFMDPDRTHYGQLCACTDALVKWSLDGADILAFCDEPNATACIRVAGAFYFIRHVYSNDSDTVTEAELRKRIGAAGSWEHNFEIEFGLGDHVLFDSAEPGGTIDPETSQVITLKPGTYAVHSAEYKDPATNYLVHRLRPRHAGEQD